MKKSSSRKVGSIILCMVIIIGLFPALPASVFAKEIEIPVENSKFEEPVRIPGWQIVTGNGAISNELKFDGENSLQLTSQEGLAEVRSNKFNVSEGKYQFTAKVYFENYENVDLDYRVVFYDLKGNILEGKNSWTVSGENEKWLELQEEAQAPVGTESAEIVFASQMIEHASANIDHVKIVKLDDMKELQLNNNSFESAVEIPGWLLSGSLLTTTPYEGNKKLRLLDSSDQIQVQAKSVRIPVTPNSKYKALAKMKVIKQSHSVEFAITFLDNTNKQVGFKNELLKGKAGLGWIDISLEEVAPVNAVTMQISFNSGKISLTDVYFDEVSLLGELALPPIEEISDKIVNPGFEMPLSEGGSIPGWTPENGTPGIAISSSIFANGSQSLHLYDSSDKSGLRVLSDKVAVVPGKSYLAKVKTNVVNQSHNIVTEVHYYDSNDKEISDKVKIELFGNLPKNQWTELKTFTDVPNNAAYARIAIYSGGISLTEAYFDDVTLELAEEDKLLDRSYANPINLGEMVHVQLGQASVIQENKMGENEVYYHSNGLPGTFSVLDAETGELKFSQVIEGTEALWAMTVGPDQNVYFAGTGDGKLYRYVPELKKIEELGVNPSDNWVWDLEATEDGKIYGSTYPHASVFEYDIVTGQFRDYGTVKEGQEYARGIAVTDQHIYVGIGTTKHLFKINRVTGEKEEVIIEGHSGESGMIENMFIVNDMLLVSVGSITMLVIDPETNQVVHTFQYSNMISEPSPHNSSIIYYKFKNDLYQYDFNVNQSKLIEGIPMLPDTVRVKDMEWISLSSGEIVLSMVTQYGEFVLYNPISNELKFVELDISSQSVAIQALETGHDGKLYMGGYQRGMSIFNPFSKELEVNMPSFAQPEGIGFLNGKVFYGTYVGAIMYSYDPLKPVDLTNNPKFEYDIKDEQDRPFTITSGDNKLFVGTVPDYGILGGVLAIYDEKTDKWSQYRNIVQDQSIIGLAYRDGKLYGSTSVWGGLGESPKATEAKMFVWDVENGKKIEEFTLDIPGMDETPRMIGGLSFGPDGNLWGAVDGTIFAMDPETKEIVKSKVIRPSLYNSSKWFPYRLQWAPDGMLYTTLSRKLIAIDPDTLAYKVLVEDFMNNMSLGVDGGIYYALGNKLHKIAVPETDATVKSIKVDGKLLTDFSPGLMDYKLSSTNRATVEAEANEPGAQIVIVESETSTSIQVTATDGKSVREYKIDWEVGPVVPEYAMDVKTTFTNKKGATINQLSPNDTITAEIEVANTKNMNQDIIVVMELLDGNDKVKNTVYASRTIPKNKTKTMSVKLKTPSNVDGYKVRVTAWEGKKIKENMIPLSDEFIIKE